LWEEILGLAKSYLNALILAHYFFSSSLSVSSKPNIVLKLWVSKTLRMCRFHLSKIFIDLELMDNGKVMS